MAATTRQLEREVLAWVSQVTRLGAAPLSDESKVRRNRFARLANGRRLSAVRGGGL